MRYLTKRLTVYVNPKKHVELKMFCAKLGLSMSFFINLAIQDRIQKELNKQNKEASNGH